MSNKFLIFYILPQIFYKFHKYSIILPVMITIPYKFYYINKHPFNFVLIITKCLCFPSVPALTCLENVSPTKSNLQVVSHGMCIILEVEINMTIYHNQQTKMFPKRMKHRVLSLSSIFFVIKLNLIWITLAKAQGKCTYLYRLTQLYLEFYYVIIILFSLFLLIWCTFTSLLQQYVNTYLSRMYLHNKLQISCIIAISFPKYSTRQITHQYNIFHHSL